MEIRSSSYDRIFAPWPFVVELQDSRSCCSGIVRLTWNVLTHDVEVAAEVGFQAPMRRLPGPPSL